MDNDGLIFTKSFRQTRLFGTRYQPLGRRVSEVRWSSLRLSSHHWDQQSSSERLESIFQPRLGFHSPCSKFSHVSKFHSDSLFASLWLSREFWVCSEQLLHSHLLEVWCQGQIHQYEHHLLYSQEEAKDTLHCVVVKDKMLVSDSKRRNTEITLLLFLEVLKSREYHAQSH